MLIRADVPVIAWPTVVTQGLQTSSLPSENEAFRRILPCRPTTYANPPKRPDN